MKIDMENLSVVTHQQADAQHGLEKKKDISSFSNPHVEIESPIQVSSYAYRLKNAQETALNASGIDSERVALYKHKIANRTLNSFNQPELSAESIAKRIQDSDAQLF